MNIILTVALKPRKSSTSTAKKKKIVYYMLDKEKKIYP